MGYRLYQNAEGGRRPEKVDPSLRRDFASVRAFHEGLPGYEPTALRAWDAYAQAHGLKGLYIKDESTRFGLNAFKGLGASYALGMLGDDKQPVVSCTDGNHGRALAYFAREQGRSCRIFMPVTAEERRVRAIEEMGAQVEVLPLNYDDTVRYAQAFAKDNGCVLVQDQALDGYTEIPGNIVMGYSTLAAEALESMPEPPTHVLLQAGVGSMAGGVCWYLANALPELPAIGIVEASACPCILRSVEEGRFVSIGGEPHTIMAGLNCGEPNPVTLPVMAACAQWLAACDDDVTLRGMELAQNPGEGDEPFSSGECGAVTLGLLDAILADGRREELGLDENSIVLLVSTEGRLDG